MTKNIIELQNIKKTFTIHHEKRNSVFEYLVSIFNSKKNTEKLVALDDVSFSVKEGEMFGIIGLNGSGKTTLLKIIGKILVPDSGNLITRGELTPFLELGTGFNGELTARDNVILYGIILGLDKKTLIQKLDKIFQFAELENFADTKVKNFSTGMVARLAFSTAIQVNPDILLVDEILSVGDISFQKKSFEAFMEFKKRRKTIVYVSHNIEQIKSLCDKALWLHDGKIMADGNPSDVVEKYSQFSNANFQK